MSIQVDLSFNSMTNLSMLKFETMLVVTPMKNYATRQSFNQSVYNYCDKGLKISSRSTYTIQYFIVYVNNCVL